MKGKSDRISDNNLLGYEIHSINKNKRDRLEVQRWISHKGSSGSVYEILKKELERGGFVFTDEVIHLQVTLTVRILNYVNDKEPRQSLFPSLFPDQVLFPMKNF